MTTATGLHHITAIAGNPQRNLDFYTHLLGLRLVKKTVNFDDPSNYHLFYGDKAGNPGSILSFLTEPKLARGAPDTGQAVAVSLAVPITSFDFWSEYLADAGIDFIEPFERFGKLVIGLQDPDGLHLELVGDPAAHDREVENDSPVPAEHAVRGLHGLTLAEENYQSTGQLLTESLGFEEMDREHDRILYHSESELGAAVELIDGAELDGSPGRGTVHHIAFRAENEKEQQQMRRQLKEIGYHLTETEDRYYFSSFFFHEPGGALVEIATDKPGFSVDEKADALGRRLSLPPRLEEKRSLIKADLPELEQKGPNKN